MLKLGILIAMSPYTYDVLMIAMDSVAQRDWLNIDKHALGSGYLTYAWIMQVPWFLRI